MFPCNRGVSLSGLLMMLLGCIVTSVHSVNAVDSVPPYIHQCSRRDPNLNDCYVKAVMHIRPWLREGIPEVAVPSTEPFRLDELSLSLTGGPGGFRISLRDIDVSGISNYSVRELRSRMLQYVCPQQGRIYIRPATNKDASPMLLHGRYAFVGELHEDTPLLQTAYVEKCPSYESPRFRRKQRITFVKTL